MSTDDLLRRALDDNDALAGENKRLLRENAVLTGLLRREGIVVTHHDDGSYVVSRVLSEDEQKAWEDYVEAAFADARHEALDWRDRVEDRDW